MAINKVILVGNVGKDPEIRHLQGGLSVATVTLATTERYRDRNSGEMKEVTEWHTIVAWRQLSDLAEKYIHKGSQIYVEGRIRTRSWDDQNGNKRYTTEIIADTIQLLGRKGDEAPSRGAASQPAAPQYVPQQPAAAPQPVDMPAAPVQPAEGNNDSPITLDTEDDLPF